MSSETLTGEPVYQHLPRVRAGLEFRSEADVEGVDVAGTNYCRIFPHVDLRTGRIVVISVIDNLMKGASGQAVQNVNVMLGLPEHEGLV